MADKIEQVADDAGLKEVGSGSNVRLIGPYDQGVFYESTAINGLQVSCPVQVYLDVIAQKGCGEEAAESVLNQVIKKQW